jgi:hypothetical protein
MKIAKITCRLIGFDKSAYGVYYVSGWVAPIAANEDNYKGY